MTLSYTKSLTKAGAYVIFPWDIRKEFGKGRVKVHATLDGIPYDGSVVNMGMKDENGEICYVIGVFEGDSEEAGEEGWGYDACCDLGEVIPLSWRTLHGEIEQLFEKISHVGGEYVCR